MDDFFLEWRWAGRQLKAFSIGKVVMSFLPFLGRELFAFFTDGRQFGALILSVGACVGVYGLLIAGEYLWKLSRAGYALKRIRASVEAIQSVNLPCPCDECVDRLQALAVEWLRNFPTPEDRQLPSVLYNAGLDCTRGEWHESRGNEQSHLRMLVQLALGNGRHTLLFCAGLVLPDDRLARWEYNIVGIKEAARSTIELATELAIPTCGKLRTLSWN